MLFQKLKAMLRHLWLDEADARRAVPAEVLKRLTQRVSASEARHTGQIRICVEASLPLSYLRRLGSDNTLAQLTRQRAVMMFSKLRVWDTAHNNGVLVYLMLAERAIEIVADRGLSVHVTTTQWQAMIARMGSNFQARHFEDGLTQALEEVSALLVEHFPSTGQAGVNELPNEPVVG